MAAMADYAALAAYVYNDQRGGAGDSDVNTLQLPAQWRELADLGFALGDSLNAINPFSFTGGAYLNQSTGEIVVAYKGTDFLVEFSDRAWNTVADLLADVGLASDKGAALGLGQQLNAMAYYLAVKDWAVDNGYDPTKISFTGHSLGGGLAANMAVWFDRPATTFAAAPFENTTNSTVNMAAAIVAITAQATFSGSIAVLEEINRVRELLVGELLWQEEFDRRETAVTNVYNEGEFLQYARVFTPTVVGSDMPIDLGDDSQSLEHAMGLHSMNLHAAFLFEDRLRQMVKQIPELLETLLDTKLYAADPNTATKDLITSLVNDQIQQGFGQPSALTRFADDIDKLKSAEGIVAQEDMRKALIALAMDFHHHAPEGSTDTFFQLESGAIHFDLNDINSDFLKGLPLLRDAASSTVIGSDPFVSNGLRGATQLHIQTGSGAMNWQADALANDAAIGGALDDVMRAGDGMDFLIGGEGADWLDGGANNDTLLGGVGLDRYEFSGSFGQDVITDSDGNGTLVVDGVPLTGGKKLTDGYWISDDRLWGYSLSSRGDLVISHSGGLERITVRHWQANGGARLGITLDDAPAAPPPGTDTDRVLNGDFLARTETLSGPPLQRSNPEGQLVDVVQTGGLYFVKDAQGNLQAGTEAPTQTPIFNDQHEIIGYTETPSDDRMVLDNVLFGGAGNDRIHGLTGNDALSGGAGNDVIDGSEGDDMMAGGAGADTITGGAGDDYISASADIDADHQQLGPTDEWTNWGLPSGKTALHQGSTWGTYVEDDTQAFKVTVWSGMTDTRTDMAASEGDTIDAGAGDDRVMGSWAGDRIQGGEGNDQLDGLAGADIIEGGAGNDAIDADGIVKTGYLNSVDAAQHGADFADGGEGDDEIAGGGASDQLFGGAGADRMFGDSGGKSDGEYFVDLAHHGADYLDGEDGDDYLEGGGKEDTLYGGAGNDRLWGDTSADNVARAEHNALMWANDYLDGEGGNDSLVGGGKDDTLYGGVGDDKLWGDENNAALAGEFHGTDHLDGEDGDDHLEGGGRDDVLIGGQGADHLVGDQQGTGLSAELHGNDLLDGGEGDDTLLGSGGNDVLLGGAGNDFLSGDDALSSEEVGHYTGDDRIDGGEGDDVALGGKGMDTLQGGAGHDRMWGGEGSDSLDGGTGHDMLVGQAGDDRLAGGAGDDSLYGSEGNDTLDGGEGLDVLVGQAGDDRLAGGAGDDNLYGSEGNDVLLGGDGNDVLNSGDGNDTLDGGAGNDVFGVLATEGTKRIIDTGGVDRLILTWKSSETYLDLGSLQLTNRATGQEVHIEGFNPDDPLGSLAIEEFVLLDDDGAQVLLTAEQLLARGRDVVGTPQADVIVGTGLHERIDAREGADRVWAGGGNDTVRGGDGDDRLDGGAGIDRLEGGQGDDLLVVDDAQDVVVELADGGHDRIESAVSYTIADHVETLVLTGAANIDATGDQAANLLVGNSGRNVLDGVGGADTLRGGAGDDTYKVYDATEVVQEDVDGGYDLVQSAAARYTLTDNVEALVLASGGAWAGFGNALDNRMEGNNGGNLLDGGAGADLMVGRYGDDSYWVDNIGDEVREDEAGQVVQRWRREWVPYTGYRWVSYEVLVVDNDTVNATIDHWLGVHVENLNLLGGDALKGYGNELNNVIKGNDAANLLDGAAGDDRLVGGAGDDELFGGAGNNQLDGGGGADAMHGGTGHDHYWVDNVADRVIEDTRGGSVGGSYGQFYVSGLDQVFASVSYALPDQVERLTLTGDADIEGWGSAQDNWLTGNAGANHLHGGAGDDVYWVQNVEDVVQENAGEGHDAVYATTDFTLTDHVEVLELEYGSASAPVMTAVYGIGSSTDNTLVGNAANNELSGEGGDDHLDGRDGNDRLYGGSGNDSLTGGADTDWNDDFRDNRDLLDGGDGEDALDGGSGDDTLLGGAGDDVIYGGDDEGNEYGRVLTNHDTAHGGDGNDTLDGGTGADRLFGDAGDDRLYGGERSVEQEHYDFDTDVNWIGTLSDDDHLDGGDGDDQLDGGTGNDVLLGGAGSDALYGGDDYVEFVYYDVTGDFIPVPVAQNNHDHLDGGEGIDTLRGGSGNDTYVVDGVFTPNTDGGNGQVNLCDEAHRFGVDRGSALSWVADAVTESAGEGHDVVLSTASLDLRGQSIEEVWLLDGGPVADLDVTTGDGAQALHGNAGTNRLDGGAGADLLAGAGGDDTYVLDADDQVVELASEGFDTVRTAIDGHSLGQQLEGLVLEGHALTGSGNDADNVLVGNAMHNTLSGGAGNDTLAGWHGDDTLLGGTGEDTYAFSRGDAQDRVHDTEGRGRLHFSGDITRTDLHYSQDGQDLLITVRSSGADTGDSVRLMGWIGASERIDSITFCGGDQLALDESVLNRAPAALPDAAQLTEDGVAIALGNVLANDSDMDAGEVLSIIDAGSFDGQYGRLELRLDGAYTYALDNASLDVQSLGRGQQVFDRFTYTASDRHGATALSSLEIQITGSNDAPVLEVPIIDRVSATGHSFGFGLPTGTFSDIDQGDALTYVAQVVGADGGLQALPVWLQFNAQAQTFAGTAPTLATSLNLRVTATDTHGVVASDDFNLAAQSTDAQGKGNEGLGNGQDAPPPGHTTNWNDGLGTSPGNPGRKGGGQHSMLGLAYGISKLAGGKGIDAHRLDRGFGVDTTAENSAKADASAVARIEKGVSVDQRWFAHSGNPLKGGFQGSLDRLLVQDGYLGRRQPVDPFVSSDGRTLLDSQVQNLVSAMAAFSPSAAGQATLNASQVAAWAPLLAANWN